MLWISVKGDWLPPLKKSVIVGAPERTESCTYTRDISEGSGEWEWVKCNEEQPEFFARDQDAFTHWMDLPEPPK